MILLSRREMLAAGLSLVVVPSSRAADIRMKLAEDVSPALAEGARFGLREAERAVALLGRRITLDPDAPIVILENAAISAGEDVFTLRADQSARDRVLRTARAGRSLPAAAVVAEWHHSLYKFGASELNERFTRDTGMRMTSEHWLGWMAVKVIAEASLRAPASPLAATLARSRFDGHKGVALTFSRDTGHLQQPLYVVDTSSDTVIWPA